VEEKWETFSVKRLLEMGLNCVHEVAHSLYIKHVHNGAVANTFLGANFLGAGNAILVEERVPSATKRVQKLTATAKSTLW
jgi:hypothetical protein